MNKVLLALDIGSKRTGLAISEGGYAREYATVPTLSLIDTLKVIVAEESVSEIIIGLPLNSDGSDSAQTQFVRDFSVRLTETLNLPQTFVNEFLTTSEARRIMETMQLSEKEIGQRIDQLSAKLILEQHLNEQKTHDQQPTHS